MKKPLTSVPKRLQRMLLRLQSYDFEPEYHPGTQVVVTDTLSCAYPSDSAKSTKFTAELASLVDDEQDAELRMVASDATIKLLCDAAREDETYQLLKLQIRNVWPGSQSQVLDETREFFTFANR